MFSKNYRSQEAELKELNRVTPREFSKKSTIFKYHMAFFSLKIVIKRFKHARTLTSILKHPQKRAQIQLFSEKCTGRYFKERDDD